MSTKLTATLLALVLVTVETAGAAALSVSRDVQKDVAVTIYNGNLGLVKDIRETRLPAGTTEVQFQDVAALIDPTSVHLKSLTDPAGLKILEQNYEYDLLSSQKLMEKYVGKRVRLYQGDGTYHEATLLSTAGPVYEINGQIHLGHNGRLVLYYTYESNPSDGWNDGEVHGDPPDKREEALRFSGPGRSDQGRVPRVRVASRQLAVSEL